MKTVWKAGTQSSPNGGVSTSGVMECAACGHQPRGPIGADSQCPVCSARAAPLTIRIVPREPLGIKWFKWLFGTAMLCILPISIGILTGSTPMQWVGFIMTIIIAMGIVNDFSKTHTFHSVDEARKFLDDLT